MFTRKFLFCTVGCVAIVVLAVWTVAFAAPSPNCPVGAGLFGAYNGAWAQHNALVPDMQKASAEWANAEAACKAAKGTPNQASLCAAADAARSRWAALAGPYELKVNAFYAAEDAWRAHAASCGSNPRCVFQSLGRLQRVSTKK